MISFQRFNFVSFDIRYLYETNFEMVKNKENLKEHIKMTKVVFEQIHNRL